jgi:OmpA-OmpF porin, OOP family
MKYTHIKLLSAVIATLVSANTMAEHTFEAQLGGGRIFFEEPRNDSAVYHAGLGLVLTKNWTLEAVASRFDAPHIDINMDIEGIQYRIDAVYNIDTTSPWRPFVVFGAGDQTLTFGDSDESERDTQLNIGVGAKHSLGSNWEFRSDIRVFNSLDNEYSDLVANLGISYLFGSSAPAPVAAKPVPAAPVVVKAVDTDGDGVFDDQDKCPNTPAQYKVDTVGCPMELTESVAIKLAVKFDTNKSIVKDEYLADIGNLAKFMGQYANTVVTVEGHTDSVGSDVLNQKLSQSRAEAVKAVLITKFGVAAERITASGLGETKPVSDNTTATGREENRRVVGAVSTDVTKKQTR